MRVAEELLDEIENANGGEGPDPLASVDDPVLARIAVARIAVARIAVARIAVARIAVARIAVAQIRVRGAERALDEAAMAAREAGLSWQEIGNVLGVTRQSVN
nr:hypothetical protein [Actinomyces denticolens]